MNPYLNIAIQAARAGAKVLLQSMDRIDRLTTFIVNNIRNHRQKKGKISF